MKTFTSLAMLAVVGAAASANATVVYSTGFEAPAWTGTAIGTQQYLPAGLGTVTAVAGPDNWFYQSSGAGTSSANVLTINNAANAHSGNQYLKVNTAAYGNNTTTSLTTFQYHDDLVTPVAGTSDLVTVGAWVRFEGAAATRTTACGIELFDSSFNLITLIRLQSNGVFGVFAQAGAASLGLGGGLQDTWYHLEVALDYTNHNMSWFINGVDQTAVLTGGGLSNAMTLTDYFETDIITTRFSGGTGTTGNVWRIDDFSVDASGAVPAPASVALLGLGGLVAGRRRRA